MPSSLPLANRALCLLALAALGAPAAGCNAILGIDEPVPRADGGAGGSTDTAGAGGASGHGGGGSTETPSTTHSNSTTTTTTPCDTATEELYASEDGVLFNDGSHCNGAIATGTDKFANIGLGRGVFRFPLTNSVADAFDAGSIVSLALTLARAPTCGDPSPCTVKKPGSFEARPLRNDWLQGNGNTYTGPDWCRRSAGNPGPLWGSPGANGAEDVPSEPSGEATVADEDLFLVIPLDPARHVDWIGLDADGTPSLSVRVIRTDSTAVFVASMSEYGNMITSPRVTVTYCK